MEICPDDRWKRGRRPNQLQVCDVLLQEAREEEACDDLQWEHIIPVSRGGPDTIDNMVQACPACNLEKAARDPFEWYGMERQDEIPRVVLGKYLKLIFEIHEKAGDLDSADLNGDGKLDIFDLGAFARVAS